MADHSGGLARWNNPAFAAVLMVLGLWFLAGVGHSVFLIAAGEVTKAHPRGTGRLYAANVAGTLIAYLFISAAWRSRARRRRLRTKVVVAVVVAVPLGLVIADAKADAWTPVAITVFGVLAVLSAASIILELLAPRPAPARSSVRERGEPPSPATESRPVAVGAGTGSPPLSAAESARRRLWKP